MKPKNLVQLSLPPTFSQMFSSASLISLGEAVALGQGLSKWGFFSSYRFGSGFYWGGTGALWDVQPAESHAHNHKAKGRSWNAEDKAECKSIQCSNLRCGRSPLMHRKVLSVNEAGIFSLRNRAVFWISGFPSSLCAWKRNIKQLFFPSPFLQNVYETDRDCKWLLYVLVTV